MRISVFWGLVVWLGGATTAHCEVMLPKLISDHMLVQQNRPVHIWGKAAAHETVKISFLHRDYEALADDLGNWQVFLAATPHGGPYEMTIQGQNTIVIHDVLVGEVWVASGQSNMEWPTLGALNAKHEIQNSSSNSIRLFHVARRAAEDKVDDVVGKWEICAPEVVTRFSAVGYFFARDLESNVKAPVGIIEADWGGTPAQVWVSERMLDSFPGFDMYDEIYRKVDAEYTYLNYAYKADHATWASARAAGKKVGPEPLPPVHNDEPWPIKPSVLYNGMIAPLTLYTIRGVIWYQGEGNTGEPRVAFDYRRLFSALIEDWREAWNEGPFPFLFVQISTWPFGSENQPLLRESQLVTLNSTRDTGMAVTIDIGSDVDVHPHNKQEVARRLALWAEGTVYGEDCIYSGPIFRQMTVDKGKARIYFDYVGDGLRARDSGPLTEFVIAGVDRKFHPAIAVIDGATVKVSSPDVLYPVAVRYAYRNNPADANLAGSTGLPASPFRSDNWEDATMP